MSPQPTDKFRKEKLKALRNARPSIVEIERDMKSLNASMQSSLKELLGRIEAAHKGSYYPGKIAAQLLIEIIDFHTRQNALHKELIDELNIPLEELPFGEY